MNTDSSYYGHGGWWLRSPNDSNSNCVQFVNETGYSGYSTYVDQSYNGVVPALQIRL